MADNADQAAIERIRLIYQQLVSREWVNPRDVATVAVALERIVKERDALLKVREATESILAEYDSCDEFNRAYRANELIDETLREVVQRSQGGA